MTSEACVERSGAHKAYGFWSGLLALRSGAGLLKDWQWAFGPAFGSVRPFIYPIVEQERQYPCTAEPACDCRHQVREVGDALVAVCACGPGECEPIPVQPEDLVIYQLDWGRLGRAVRDTLGLAEARPEGVSRGSLHPVGTYEPLGAPVFLTLSDTPDLGRDLLSDPTLRNRPILVLSVPADTTQLDAMQAMLCAQAGVCLSLAEFLEVPSPPDHNGKSYDATHLGPSTPVTNPASPPVVFTARGALETALLDWPSRVARAREPGAALEGIHRELKAVRKTFESARPAPEPVPDEVAARLFGLVRQLESSRGWRKAPVLQVFRLYCLEGLTAQEVARRCGCAKSLVVLRLRQIRQKLGRDPAQLRAFSSQFERIEDSLSDSRARRIYRPAAMYGDESGET